MNSRARSYVLLALGISGTLICGVGLLNYLVDPYNLFDRNSLGVYISAERESKPNQMRHAGHNAVLLGNSRMAMVPVAQLEAFRFFNAGFGGATAEEIYYFVAHHVQNEELVVLGVDVGAGDPPSLQGDIFAPPGIVSMLNNLLNFSTAEYSVRTISEHLAGHPASLRADGSFYAQRWFELYDRPDPAQLEWQITQLVAGSEHYAGTSLEKMTFYARIAEALRRRGILCVVLVPPLHESAAKRLQTRLLRDAFAAWRGRLDSVFPHVIDLSFSPYGAAENFFQSDPSHFKPEAGVRMLNVEVIPVASRLLAERANRRTDAAK